MHLYLSNRKIKDVKTIAVGIIMGYRGTLFCAETMPIPLAALVPYLAAENC